MTLPGWMPGAKVLPAPAGNFFKGRDGHAVKAAVLHIMQGSYQSGIDEFRRVGSIKSAHFCVSPTGDITQMVSIFDTAYANGLSYTNGRWIDPEETTVQPTWQGLTPPVNPNFQTVSIEHGGKSGDMWTPAMIAADATILRFVRAAYLVMIVDWTPHTTLIGHYEISPINRAHCPGTGCPFQTIAAAANGNTPAPTIDYTALWGQAFPYFSQSGIAQEWRRSAMVLGAAASDETKDAAQRVWRLFDRGAISYDPKTGECVSYFPRSGT